MIMLYYEHEGGKPVSLLELFFDLIFVYAISKMTEILENGSVHTIDANSLGLYLLAALVVLQVWLGQTNYNNRFSVGRWYENLFMIIHKLPFFKALLNIRVGIVQHAVVNELIQVADGNVQDQGHLHL